ncbi:MAG: PDZ domain-containing protein [Bacilli bacterium]|nr:PDZ domain-containing protein [Bacilli bacterium]
MKCKNIFFKIILLLIIIPINTFAYSKYIIASGKTIGIEVNSKGILVVGFYKINNEFIAKNAGFRVGDNIIKINNKPVDKIDTMIDIINNKDSNKINFTIIRNKKTENINLNLVEDNSGILKTGLYVKDQINGIGTLTYIDPNTKIFGALGHEIIESSTAKKFEIKDGKIFSANVSDITKSRSGDAGEKNAEYNKDKVDGNIKDNDITGIYGIYNNTIKDLKTIEVGNIDDIKKGNAIIKTVVNNNKVEDFNIEIINIDKNSKTKNILFQITDKRLLNKTGGVVQGMSGSPIIQDNKIIGAVNYVIVNDTTKGYGIFITTMLEEGEK